MGTAGKALLVMGLGIGAVAAGENGLSLSTDAGSESYAAAALAGDFALGPSASLEVQGAYSRQAGGGGSTQGKIGVSLVLSPRVTVRAAASGLAGSEAMRGAGVEGGAELLVSGRRAGRRTWLSADVGAYRFWQSTAGDFWGRDRGIVQTSASLGLRHELSPRLSVQVTLTKFLYATDSGAAGRPLARQPRRAAVGAFLASSPTDSVTAAVGWQTTRCLSLTLTGARMRITANEPALLVIGAGVSLAVSSELTLGAHGTRLPGGAAAGLEVGFRW